MTQTESGQLILVGRAKPRAVVKVQVRRGGQWRNRWRARATSQGRFRFGVPAPKAKLSLRVAAGGRASAPRVVHAEQPGSTAPVTPPAPSPTPSSPPSGPPAKPPISPAPHDACGPRVAKADGTWWKCSFVDDFDGATLDRSKWLVQATSYSGMTSGNNDCYVDDPSTVSVGGGLLRVSSERNLEPFTCSSPYGDFTATSTAGTVSTRDRFSQTFGRFEFRARMPATPGIPGPHSALWLYPERDIYGAWPASGEIDVAEWFSAAPDNVYPSAHYAGEIPFQSSGFDCRMPTASSRFHDYAVEWSETTLRFYYDGNLCWSHQWSATDLPASTKPFDHPFNLIVTQVWGSLWNSPTSATPDRATLEVEHVKAWR